jgi:large subunit ribosomal protein L3
MQNLVVVRIDTVLNLIFVKGAVPGPDGGHVFITDAKRKVISEAIRKTKKGLAVEECLPAGLDALPFPVGTKEMAEKLPKIVVAPTRGRNPFVALD